MNIPVEWLRSYIDISKTSDEIAESFTALGLMLDSPIKNITNGEYKTDLLDLEHRMDRADWLSIIGCARDLCAMEKATLKYPELHTEKGKPGGNVKIEVKCPNLVNRFNTRVFRGIKVKESPDWLKNRLETYGIPSKNNIVDITNYVMVEFGQPMHAQDMAKMDAQEIVIRNAKEGEMVTTLLGETVELDPSMFVLTQNDTPTVIGGIVGGNSTGVDETTTEIVLDAGNYNQVNIRKSSRKLKIQNETVLRYDKFLHPMLTEIAIQRATYLILELAGGEYYENKDWYPNKMPLNTKTLHLDRIKKVSGIDFKMPRVKEILIALEYKVISSTEETIELEIPYFRTDVEVEDDLVADILRVNNYKNIPLVPISATPPKEITPSIYKFEEKLRNVAINLGLHEHITNPLVKKGDNKNQVVLENVLSSEFSALRTTIYETLLPVIDSYKKHKVKEAGVFEVGLTYTQTGDKFENYVETRELQVITYSTKSVLEQSKKTKKLLSGLLTELGIDYLLKETGQSAEIMANGTKIGNLWYNSFRLFTQKLEDKESQNTRVVQNLITTSTEDISITCPVNYKLGKLYKFIQEQNEITSLKVVDEYANEGNKTITIRITRGSMETNEASNFRKTLLSQLKSRFRNITIKQ